MAFLKMNSGAHYHEYIQQILSKKAARSYLEIGVRDGGLLSQVEVPSIGVDPNFTLSHNIMGRKKRLILLQCTSDVFFRDYDPRFLLASPIDVVFLDGLHQFEYLLRDFISAETICHRDSLIMLDDCLPCNAEMTERLHLPNDRVDQKLADWWTGDVWKVVRILQRYRQDLKITIADTQPTGNIGITNLNPSCKLLREKYYEIIAEFAAVPSDEDTLLQYYHDIKIENSSNVLLGFEASRFIGP